MKKFLMIFASLIVVAIIILTTKFITDYNHSKNTEVSLYDANDLMVINLQNDILYVNLKEKSASFENRSTVYYFTDLDLLFTFIDEYTAFEITGEMSPYLLNLFNVGYYEKLK